jgi:hypothetical protein
MISRDFFSVANNLGDSVAFNLESDTRLLAFVIKELQEVLPPILFFAASFNLIILTTDLILADYRRSVGNFMVATMAALVVGKAVLVANVAPFLRRFDTAPMIQPEAVRLIACCPQR